jgi:hypothetical protein
LHNIGIENNDIEKDDNEDEAIDILQNEGAIISSSGVHWFFGLEGSADGANHTYTYLIRLLVDILRL